MSNASANSANPRAALLSGLRTGGVRSAAIPHTAAPGGSFHIPRIPDQEPQYAQFAGQHPANRAVPMTAAVDGGFLRQQTAPFTPGPVYPQHAQAQAQAFQMQIQLEMMRMQALQAQQYQAQLFAAQTQRRPNFNPPATAGPLNPSFDLRSPNLNAPMMPMTAAIDGKFTGMRAPALAPGFVGHFPAEHDATTVISGGTALGSPAPVVSKSETAANWRRGGNNNSVLRKKSTERNASPPPANVKARPVGLSINSVAAQPVPVVAIDSSESENDDGYSTSSSDSAPTNSPPTTPRSSSSVDLKDTPAKAAFGKSVVTRQPHGPPSGADELGPRNFASRVAARGPIIIVA